MRNFLSPHLPRMGVVRMLPAGFNTPWKVGGFIRVVQRKCRTPGGTLHFDSESAGASRPRLV